MKILITGATGYLGGAIVQEAVNQGYEVRGLCRHAPETERFPNEAEVIRGDITNYESIVNAVRGCDAVIHSAAKVSIWEPSPEIFYKINVQGTENVIKAAIQENVKRIVYTSSFFALGPTTETPADENWFNEEIPPHTEYARSKRQAERNVREWIKQGHDIVTLYPVLIYGPGKLTQGNNISQMLQEFCQRKIPGTLGPGDKRWTFSYIDDVVQGHLLALQKAPKAERYLLGGEEATLIELFAMLEEITGIKAPRRQLPLWLGKTVGWIEEMRARLFKNHVPKLTRDVVDVYQCHWRFSSQKAISQLSYMRTPLKMGLHKTLESMGLAPAEERGTIL